jgi:hypothetical protein
VKTTKRNFQRLMLGDVIEIPLSKRRVAYAQFVYNYNKPPVWGNLIRVLPGIYKTRPENFTELVRDKERFYTFFPAGVAVTRHLIEIVANEEIPRRCRTLPLFKANNRDFGGAKDIWWLWDGKSEWKVQPLPRKYYDLPIQESVTLGVLIDRIKKGWSPRDEVD